MGLEESKYQGCMDALTSKERIVRCFDVQMDPRSPGPADSF